MRKENRVIVTYLTTLRDSINEIIKEVGKCDKKDIEAIIEKSLYTPELEKSSERVQKFLDKLRSTQ